MGRPKPRVPSVHYRLGGEGPFLTLIHGVGADSTSFDAVATLLEPQFQILRYDLRGHGRSDKPPGPYALEDFVRDLVHLLDDLEVASTHLAGFSLGGLIAQAFTLAHAARVGRLAILSAVSGRTAAQRVEVSARADRLEARGPGSTVEAAIERWFSPEFRAAYPEVVRAKAASILANDPAAYAAAYRVFAQSDLADRLHEIRVPTLIMTGEHDVGSSPRMARLMHRRIEGSRLQILPGLRHAILTEAPALVAEHLQRFLVGAGPG